MVDITRILNKDCTRASLGAHSRKRAIQAAADLLANSHPELSARKLFDELMARERLGTTGLGDGVAIPHCRIPCERVHGAFLQLSEAVDYDAIDGENVDLLFVLVVPPEETTAHLELLANLARVFNDADNRNHLRGASSDSELFDQLVELFASLAT
jgi:PTS system nitrogen regulatory IIA component